MSMQSEAYARFKALFGQLGMTFDGNRDIYATFGYPKVVTYAMALQRYTRQEIAGRVVDAEPQAVWSLPPQPGGDEAFAEAWNNMRAQHDLYKRLEQLDRLVGIGKFALLLIGVDDGKDLEHRLDESEEKAITFLRAYGEGVVEIKEYEQDASSSRFGLPTIYEIVPDAADKSKAAGKAFKVHYSRVLHVAENVLDNDIYGSPRIVRVFNNLQDIEKVAGGSAETYWMTSNRGMQLDVDKDMTLTEDDADMLADEVDEYVHGQSRVMRTKGVTVNSLGSDTADPRGAFGVQVALLSGATGIPQRILLGSEAGQLASEQDRANWAVRIESRRTIFIEPSILFPLVKKLVRYKILPVPSALLWVWPEAFRQSPLEKAQTGAQQARTLSNVAKALSDTTSPINLEEGRRIISSSGSIVLYDDPEDTLPPATEND